MDAPETSFTPLESSVASLASAYANRAPVEWIKHVAEAREAGLHEKYVWVRFRLRVRPCALSPTSSTVHHRYYRCCQCYVY